MNMFENEFIYSYLSNLYKDCSDERIVPRPLIGSHTDSWLQIIQTSNLTKYIDFNSWWFSHLMFDAISKCKLYLIKPLFDNGIMDKIDIEEMNKMMACVIATKNPYDNTDKIQIFNLFWEYRDTDDRTYIQFAYISNTEPYIYNKVNNFIEWISWSKLDMTWSINKWSPQVVRKAVQTVLLINKLRPNNELSDLPNELLHMIFRKI